MQDPTAIVEFEKFQASSLGAKIAVQQRVSEEIYYRLQDVLWTLPGEVRRNQSKVIANHTSSTDVPGVSLKCISLSSSVIGIGSRCLGDAPGVVSFSTILSIEDDGDAEIL